MAEKRRKFPREFKTEAVRRIVEGGEPTVEVARSLDLPAHMLYNWVRQFKVDATEAFRGNGVVTSQDEELRKLRRELAQVREERDILKKATAFFAKDSR
jgi:transposase